MKFQLLPANEARESTGMVVLSTRVPAELAEALDTWAAQQHVTRAALLRAIVEDVIDVGEPPSVPQSTSELLAELRAVEDEHLRELSRR